MKRETKVGLTIVVLVSLLVFGYLWVKEYRIRVRKHEYYISFPEVGWVKKGDLVTILGVPKGRVEKVVLYPDSVVVKVSLDEIYLTEGSHAYIESQGLIGQMRISIILGKGDTLKEGSLIRGVKRKDLGELISSVGDLVDSLLTVVDRVNSLSITVENFTNSLNNNLVVFRRELTDFKDFLKDLLASQGENLDTSFVILNKTLTDLDSLVATLQSSDLIKRISSDTLYNDIDSLILEMRSLIKDIKENPSRYFKVSVF